ncbi:MAG: hypothetical protein ACR2RF_33030 [Geminicoccaceae bacterium]
MTLLPEHHEALSGAYRAVALLEAAKERLHALHGTRRYWARERVNGPGQVTEDGLAASRRTASDGSRNPA